MFVSSKDLAAIIEVARFFTYVGQCQHNGYISEKDLTAILRDRLAYANWQRYEKGKS